MRQQLSLISQDITTALRDNLIVYMLIAPLLISFGLRLFLTSVEETGTSFAISDEISTNIVEVLRGYGSVEVLKQTEVKARVEKIDSVAGLILKDEKLTLLLEGNEPPEIIELYKSIVEKETFAVGLAEITHRSLGKKGSILKELLAISMVMLAMLIGSIVSGFNIVAERDTKAINSIAVSPLTTRQFIAARGLIANFAAIAIAIGSSWVMMGTEVDYLHLMLILLSSGLLTTLLALIIGVTSSNQIGAIAMMKLISPLYIGVPMLDFFLPDRLRLFLYWLPNYWQFKALSSILLRFPQDIGFWQAIAMTFLLSGIYVVLISRLISRKLKLR